VPAALVVNSGTTFAAGAPRVGFSAGAKVPAKREGTMSAVRRHIEVQAPPSVALATWSHFVRSVMNGHQRLACDELACVDAVRAGLVAFEPVDGGGRTDVIYDEANGPSRAVLEQNVARDLVVFKDYIERGGNQVGKPTRAEEQAMAEDEERHTHAQLHRRIGAEDEAISYQDHFPS
jgi:hypothetical protein